MNDTDFDKLFNDKMNEENEFPNADKNWDKVAAKLSEVQNAKLLRTRLFRAAVLVLLAGIFVWQWAAMRSIKNEIAELKNNYQSQNRNYDSLQHKINQTQDFKNKKSENNSVKNNFENKNSEKINQDIVSGKNNLENNFQINHTEKNSLSKNYSENTLPKNNKDIVAGKNNSGKINQDIVSEKNYSKNILQNNNQGKNNKEVVLAKSNTAHKNLKINSEKNNTKVILENNNFENKSEENLGIKNIQADSPTPDAQNVSSRNSENKVSVSENSEMPVNEIVLRSQVISELKTPSISPIALHAIRINLPEDGFTLQQLAPAIRVIHPPLLQNFSIIARVGTDVPLLANRDDGKLPPPNPNPNPNPIQNKKDPHTSFNSNINYGIVIEKSFGMHWRANVSADYAQSNFVTEADNPKIYVPEPPHIMDFDFENAHADFKSWFLGAGAQYSFFERSRVHPFISLGYAYESVQPLQINYEYKNKMTEETNTQSHRTATHNENWYNIGVGTDIRIYKNISARLNTDYWNTFGGTIDKKMVRVQAGIVIGI